MDKDIRPGMIVRHKYEERYIPTWLLVCAVHEGHTDVFNKPHIHGIGLSNSPSGTVLYGSFDINIADITAAYYRLERCNDKDELAEMYPSDIETLLRTGITPSGCQVKIYNSDLTDKCLEVTWAEIEDKFGCKIKLKGE